MNKLSNLSVKVKTATVSGMILLGILLSAIPGKGIGERTRELFPGLTTEEQIVTVADVVDTNKIDAELRLAEQQAIIDNQNIKLAEQQAVIDEQKANVSNESECRKLYQSNPECKSDVYRSKSAFNVYIKSEDERKPNNYRNTYSICQNIISRCD